MQIEGVCAFILCILCGSAYSDNPTKNGDVWGRFELLEQKVYDQNAVVSKLQQVAEMQSYMINDQADLIQKQSKEIEELKRVAKLRSNEIDYANPGPLVANGGPSVLFYARISKEEIAHIPMNQKLIFDQTILNKGHGYHSSTGTFVAPVAGIYFFSLSVSTLRDGKDIHAGIMKNGMPVAGAYAHGYGQGSTTVVIPLNAFEPVWVSNMHHADAYLWGHTLTSFMGFRLGDY